MAPSVIVAAVRTPVGRFGSALRSCSAVDLGSVAIAEAVRRAGVDPGGVDYVLMGHVLQAGTGQISAAQAWESGRSAGEVVGVPVPGPRGETTVVDRDEGIRPGTTSRSLAELAPAFTPEGTITAGNASQLSDGAAATVVMSAERAAALSIEPLAEILAHGMCAERFEYLHTVPAIALERALKRAGMQ